VAHFGRKRVAHFRALLDRQVGWGAYIDVRGNRYSVPGHLAGQTVRVHLGLEGSLRVYADEMLVAQHHLQAASQAWVSLPSHHRLLWQSTLKVEQRPLQSYEELL
jgi:hypothetical protein